MKPTKLELQLAIFNDKYTVSKIIGDLIEAASASDPEVRGMQVQNYFERMSTDAYACVILSTFIMYAVHDLIPATTE